MNIQQLIDELNFQIEQGVSPETIVKIFEVEREENWDKNLNNLVKEVFYDVEVLSSDGEDSYLPIYCYSDNHALGGRCRPQHPYSGIKRSKK